MIDPFRDAGPPKARSACVIVGATPDEVVAIHVADHLTIRANRLGTLVMGRLGSLPIDYAEQLDGTVYDVLYNPETGWFAVTIFAGMDPPRRFDASATGETAGGYVRVRDILGAREPRAILAALDVPADLLGDP
jgi:hypothetical protein